MKLKYDRFEFELDPKDLLFMAVSGSHSYGTNRADSDLDLRGVTIPTFRDVIRLQGSQVHTIFKKMTPEIDLEIVPIRKWLQILLKGNGNYLENLWQEKIYPRTMFFGSMGIRTTDEIKKYHLITDLKRLVMKHGLSKRFAKHYCGFAMSQQKDFKTKWKTKCLLYVYRVLGSGIILYRDKKVEYNLARMVYEYDDIFPTKTNVALLLQRYDSEKSIMNKAFSWNVDKDIDILKEIVMKLADESDFPDKPDYAPFNQFLETQYRIELTKD